MYNVKLNTVRVKSPTGFTCNLKRIKIEDDIDCLNGTTVSGFTRYKRELNIDWTDLSKEDLNVITTLIYANSDRTVDVTAYDVYENQEKTITYVISSDFSTPIKLWKNNKCYYDRVSIKLIERGYWK